MSRIAYVLRSVPPADQAAKIRDGTEPSFDFDRFIERGLGCALPMYPAAGPRSILAGVMAKVGSFGAAITLLTGPGRDFDQFITTGEDIGIPLALSMIPLGIRRPIHIIFHGHYIGGKKFDAVIAILRRRRNVHWHPLSESLRQALIQRFGVAADRCHATGYAIDTDFFRPTDAPASAIVSAGMARRDYRSLIEAVRGFDVPVRIAAGSTWFPTTVNVETSDLPANIEVRSQGNYLNLRTLYASALFVVVPMEQVQHACGYAVIAEAMAMGKAVIATRTQANSDFVIEGETGFLVEPGDVVGLRDCMQRLLDDPRLACTLGRQARLKMEARYALDHFCERMNAVVCACETGAAGGD